MGQITELINILGAQTEVLERTGHLEDALRLTTEMEERPRELGEYPARLQALQRRGQLQRLTGNADGAVDTLKRIVREANVCNGLETSDNALEDLAFTYVDAKDLAAAIRTFDRQEANCRRLGHPARLAAASSTARLSHIRTSNHG